MSELTDEIDAALIIYSIMSFLTLKMSIIHTTIKLIKIISTQTYQHTITAPS